MRTAIDMPQSGTQTEGSFISWQIEIGQLVEAGQVIATVETDKAVIEVEAPANGIVAELIAHPNDQVSTDSPLGFLAAVEASAPVPSFALMDGAGKTEAPASPEKNGDSIPLSPVRRRIAENLLRATQTTARASTTVEVDFEAVANVRRGHQAAYRELHGASLTYLPFIAFATCRALRQLPDVAARIDLDAAQWTRPATIDLGIAVARDEGLTVPIIADADQLGLFELAGRIDTTAKAVREGRFSPAGASAGTITITNPGSFGSYISQPISNPGETSILCIDGIERRAVVTDEGIVARLRTFLTLAFDHRIVDGYLALAFLNKLKADLQSCDENWLEMRS